MMSKNIYFFPSYRCFMAYLGWGGEQGCRQGGVAAAGLGFGGLGRLGRGSWWQVATGHRFSWPHADVADVRAAVETVAHLGEKGNAI